MWLPGTMPTLLTSMHARQPSKIHAKPQPLLFTSISRGWWPYISILTFNGAMKGGELTNMNQLSLRKNRLKLKITDHFRRIYRIYINFIKEILEDVNM